MVFFVLFVLFKYTFLSVAAVIYIKKGKEQEQLPLSGEEVQFMFLNSPILLEEQFFSDNIFSWMLLCKMPLLRCKSKGVQTR